MDNHSSLLYLLPYFLDCKRPPCVVYYLTTLDYVHPDDVHSVEVICGDSFTPAQDFLVMMILFTSES